MIPAMHVFYVAKHESGRVCELYPWQVQNEQWVKDWEADGWKIETVTTVKWFKSVGEVCHDSLITDYETTIRNLVAEVQELRSDRDTWKALANR